MGKKKGRRFRPVFFSDLSSLLSFVLDVAISAVYRLVAAGLEGYLCLLPHCAQVAGNIWRGPTAHTATATATIAKALRTSFCLQTGQRLGSLV